MRKKPQLPEKMITIILNGGNSKHLYFCTYPDVLRLKQDIFNFFLNYGLDNYEFDFYFNKLTSVVRSFFRQAQKHAFFMMQFKNLFTKDEFFVEVTTYIETL